MHILYSNLVAGSCQDGLIMKKNSAISLGSGVHRYFRSTGCVRKYFIAQNIKINVQTAS